MKSSKAKDFHPWPDSSRAQTLKLLDTSLLCIRGQLRHYIRNKTSTTACRGLKMPLAWYSGLPTYWIGSA